MDVSFVLDYGLCFLCKEAGFALFICGIDFIKDEIKEGERDEIVTEKEILLISLMLFSMFFGRGILYFHLFLGMKQENMCGFH